MKLGIFSLAVSLALWGSLGVDFAAAQPGRPPIRGFPQAATNPQIAQMQQQLNQLNPDGSLKSQLTQGLTTSSLGGLQTGHSAGFFNYGHYFPLNPPGGATTATTAGFGPGFGGFNAGLAGAGFGTGFGVGNIGGRTLFGNSVVQPLIRP
jgi:hypothetical protein